MEGLDVDFVVGTEIELTARGIGKHARKRSRVTIVENTSSRHHYPVGFCVTMNHGGIAMSKQRERDNNSGQTINLISYEGRLSGSRSSQTPIISELRKRPGQDDIPDDDDRQHPPNISVPDIFMQFTPCLPENWLSPLQNVLSQKLGVQIQPAVCLSESDRIGIWFTPVAGNHDALARAAALHRLNIINNDENVAIFINPAFINAKAQSYWNSYLSGSSFRLNTDGYPDSSGPTQLTGLRLFFRDPNQIVSIIDGSDDRPWPDVSFELTITDTFGTSGGEIIVSTSRDLDVDTSFLNVLTGLFAFVFPPLGAVFGVESLWVSAIGAPNSVPSLGSIAVALLAQYLPKEILLPGTDLKLAHSFHRVAIDPRGVFAGGDYTPLLREPAVTIIGPRDVAINTGEASVVRRFSVSTIDLVEPLQIEWDGDGVIADQGAVGTNVTFDTHLVRAGHVADKHVTVRVTDPDHGLAEGQIAVRIHVVPEDDDDFPPVCRVKPWLPQCETHMRSVRDRRVGN